MRAGNATALAFAAAMLSASCGGAQTGAHLFAQEWEDDGGREVEAVRAKLAGARPEPGVDVVVGVAGAGDRVVGQLLGGGAPWAFSHALDARPIIAGHVVVGSGGGELFALEARSGRRLWARPTGGLALRGAGNDGGVTVVTLASPTGKGSTLLAVQQDGTVLRQIETPRELGAPAVLAGFVFVPWGNQYVSVLDLSNGNEAARILLREKVSRAFTVGSGLYFGEIGIFRFDDRIRGASRNEASHVSIPTREIPGTPRLMTPGTERVPPVAGAPDKIRLYARPSGPEGALGLDAGRVYATYFRLVMGLDSGKGALAWVHTHGSDVLGGAAGAGAFVACDEQGGVTVLDAKTGGVVATHALGTPLKACVVQADAFRAPGAPAATKPLAAQIAFALTTGDAELVTAHKLLLRELAALPDEGVTKTLVDLASDPRTAPDLLAEARVALAARRNGAPFMLAALERHYDYLRDVLRPPPVGPIAQALAAMKEKRAAPLLASHLLDPANPAEDVQRAAAALAVLATPAEAPPLRRFFALYRASAESEETAAAVVSVGEALLKVGGAEGRAAVELAAGDAMTHGLARPRLEALLAQPK